MKIKLIIFIIFFSNQVFSQENLKVGTKAKKIFISNWLTNKPTDTILNGKYIVLLFWDMSNTSQYIRNEKVNYIENFNKLQEKFSRNDLYFISVSNNDNVKELKKYFKNQEFKTIAVVDKSRRTQKGFGNKDGSIQFPLVVLIDNKGYIQWVASAYSLDEKFLTDFLNGTLKPFNALYRKKK